MVLGRAVALSLVAGLDAIIGRVRAGGAGLPVGLSSVAGSDLPAISCSGRSEGWDVFVVGARRTDREVEVVLAALPFAAFALARLAPGFACFLGVGTRRMVISGGLVRAAGVAETSSDNLAGGRLGS